MTVSPLTNLVEYRRQRDAIAAESRRHHIIRLDNMVAVLSDAAIQIQLDAFATESRHYLATITTPFEQALARSRRAAEYLELKHRLHAERLELACERDRVQRLLDTLTNPPETHHTPSGKTKSTDAPNQLTFMED